MTNTQTELNNTILTFNPDHSKLVTIGSQKFYTSINFSHTEQGHAIYYMRIVTFEEAKQYQEEHIYLVKAKIGGLYDCREGAIFFIPLHFDLVKGDEKTSTNIANTEHIFNTITA
jgi:hypothetical protein